jgi:hypothetical protein
LNVKTVIFYLLVNFLKNSQNFIYHFTITFSNQFSKLFRYLFGPKRRRARVRAPFDRWTELTANRDAGMISEFLGRRSTFSDASHPKTQLKPAASNSKLSLRRNTANPRVSTRAAHPKNHPNCEAILDGAGAAF